MALSTFSIYAQTEYRVVGTWLPFVLPFLAGSLMVLTLTDLALESEELKKQFMTSLHVLRRWIRLLIAAFAIHSTLIVINGAFDDSPGAGYHSQISTLSETKTSIAGQSAFPWVVVRWEGGQEGDRVFVNWNERYQLWGGEFVKMQVRPGFLAIPWVKTIDHNDEHYFKEIVSRIPTATIAWRNLLYLYIDQNRLDEARDAALEYLRLYPQGYTQALHVGIALKQMSRYRDAAPFFEYVVDHHPTYDAYQQLGWTLQQMGEIDRAATVFETSLPLNPNFWEAYFHLGEVYAGQARYAESLVMYQKVLEFHPHFPEVESAVMELKKRMNALAQISGKDAALYPSPYCQPWTSVKCRNLHIPAS
ncbi:MAG: tetratricopeptide repeat protein [Nitrospiraceae bacterium]